MGTVLKDRNKNIKSTASRYSLLVVTAAVIGIGLLLFQAFSVYTGKSFRPFNFDIGTLWNADDNSQVNLPIQEEDIVIQVISQSNNLSEVAIPSTPIDLSRFATPMKAKEAKFVEADAVARPSKSFDLQSTSLNRIDLLSIPLHKTSEFAFKYMQQLENDYLINPNMQSQKGKWFYGFSFAPSINYRTFAYRDGNIAGVAQSGNTRYTYGMTETYRNQSDKAISSYYTGIDFGFNINSHLSVHSGLYYSVYGESILVNKINEDNPNYEDASFIGQVPIYSSPDNAEQGPVLDYENRYSYIEVPIVFNCIVKSTNKLDISLQLGAYFQKLDHVNALVYDFETDYYYWLPQNDVEVYRDYGFGTMAGLSISQFISKSVEIFVNPQFKMNHASTYDDSYSVVQKQYSSGLRIGLRQHIIQY